MHACALKNLRGFAIMRPLALVAEQPSKVIIGFAKQAIASLGSLASSSRGLASHSVRSARSTLRRRKEEKAKRKERGGKRQEERGRRQA